MKHTILEINKYIKNHEWCDFSIINFDFNLEIGGSTSFSDNPDIKIIFEDVFFVECLSEWKTDTSIKEDIISLANIEENNIYNFNYDILEDYLLFKIIAEDKKKPLFISAKNIKFEIII